MKDANVSLNRSITPETEDLLNKQIMMEGMSSAHYLSMASWCDMKGYTHSAQFLYNHSEEERMHMLKLFHYVNDAGGHAIQPGISNIKHKFNTLREVFEDVLSHEINVTKSINQIVDHCFNVKDFATMNFMQWYVAEQREEELIARRALELFKIIGEEGIGLWTIDQEIGKLEASMAGSETGAVK
ncbi:MAG: ferritin [Cyclobacteriaceae bacterium]|nr:ferritin [Cyclobacteriaceae bacterium]